MTDHSRSAHLALLARARTALATHTKASGDIADVVAELDAAIAWIGGAPVPWSVPVHLAVIGHGDGTSVVAAVSRKGLLDQVAVFCRSRWGEINDSRDPGAMEVRTMVRDYFNLHPEDQLVSRLEWIDPDLGYDPERLEIGNYLTLSSGHVSWQTTLEIDEWMTLDPSERPVTIADTHYGWLVSTLPPTADEQSKIPADLAAALTFARDKGCNYLILDRDAGATDHLPCFEW
ncbi:MAG: hypothetical protein EPO45_17215 [Sphingobium sp.]|nr:MAG: hypothetical protein EPO45_17215 [Sphingobium sp.]